MVVWNRSVRVLSIISASPVTVECNANALFIQAVRMMLLNNVKAGTRMAPDRGYF
jgi:hypothetical protein